MIGSRVRQRQCPERRTAIPTPPQKALARGHRWLAMVESGKSKWLKEIAKREGVDTSYVRRMVTLTIRPAQLKLIDPSGRSAGAEGGAMEPN